MSNPHGVYVPGAGFVTPDTPTVPTEAGPALVPEQAQAPHSVAEVATPVDGDPELRMLRQQVVANLGGIQCPHCTKVFIPPEQQGQHLDPDPGPDVTTPAASSEFADPRSPAADLELPGIDDEDEEKAHGLVDVTSESSESDNVIESDAMPGYENPEDTSSATDTKGDAFTDEEKLKIVRHVLASDDDEHRQEIAGRYGITAPVLTEWVTAFRAGTLGDAL